MNAKANCAASCCTIAVGTHHGALSKDRQLAAPNSKLAQQVAKDPYTFQFQGLAGDVAERDLEQALNQEVRRCESHAVT